MMSKAASVPCESLPVVAMVGRPNVGKSTLVNRIVGRREAIVEERPGVTRDRKVVEAEWSGRRFQLVDTGGWLADDEALAAAVSRQAERAIREADVIMLVVDAAVGITEEDARVAKVLERADKPVLVVANKVDSTNRENDIWDFMGLGLGPPMPVSALHGRASGELLDALIALLPEEVIGRGDDEEGDLAEMAFGVAIVGRPNVGKSTLFNRLVGDDRAVVHDMPGTTRDAIDTIVETPEGAIRFIDTAGMRRKNRIEDGPEYYSLVRSLQAIDHADAALVVLDATEGVTHQDRRLAERVDASGCTAAIVINKWELLDDPEARAILTAEVEEAFSFLGYAPILKLSALTGKGTHRILPALFEAREAYHRRIPTAALTRVVLTAQAAHPAPLVRGRNARVLYATQAATDPPTFTLFVNRRLPPTYLRYLERKIRESFDLGPTPVKMRVKAKNG